GRRLSALKSAQLHGRSGLAPSPCQRDRGLRHPFRDHHCVSSVALSLMRNDKREIESRWNGSRPPQSAAHVLSKSATAPDPRQLAVPSPDLLDLYKLAVAANAQHLLAELGHVRIRLRYHGATLSAEGRTSLHQASNRSKPKRLKSPMEPH